VAPLSVGKKVRNSLAFDQELHVPARHFSHVEDFFDWAMRRGLTHFEPPVVDLLYGFANFY
jgi:hypothetical protein